MTEIRVIEGSDGVDHVITIFQQGSSSAEDLSAYSTTTMVVKSLNRQTTIATLTLTNTDLANGVVTYTTDNDGFTVPAGNTEIKYKAQIVFTAAGLKDATQEFDFVVENDLA